MALLKQSNEQKKNYDRLENFVKDISPELADIFKFKVPEIIAKPLVERSTEELITQIDAGKFLIEIARAWGVSTSELRKWVEVDADRTTRAKSARRNQSEFWDWLALQVLLHAPSDRVEIVRAEKIAQHCRWRAEVFNRDEYGQNLKLTHSQGGEAKALSTRELEAIARGSEYSL